MKGELIVKVNVCGNDSKFSKNRFWEQSELVVNVSVHEDDGEASKNRVFLRGVG